MKKKMVPSPLEADLLVGVGGYKDTWKKNRSLFDMRCLAKSQMCSKRLKYYTYFQFFDDDVCREGKDQCLSGRRFFGRFKKIALSIWAFFFLFSRN